MPFQNVVGIGRREFILLIASMMAISALSIDSMLPAFPLIESEFGLASEQANAIQLVVYAYMFGFAFAQLIYGALADYYGRKPVVALGVTIFCIGCVGAALAPTFKFLLFMRALQGIGMAAMRVLTTTMVRDTFSGRAMSQVMSMIMMVFIIVPIIAPSLGQLLLFHFNWHSIFWALLIYALFLASWFFKRMPETLKPEFRRPISASSFLGGFKLCISNRSTLGYAVCLGLMQGVLIAYIGSSEQIFQRDVYHKGAHFPLMFGAIAVSMGIASFTNSRFVPIYGMHRMAHSALWLFLIMTTLLTVSALIFDGRPPLLIFAPILACSLFSFSLMMPNFNSIAMEPMGKIAGAASSWIGFFSTLVGTLVGHQIGKSFDGTVLPLALGYWMIGIVLVGVIFWTEKRLPLHLKSK